MQTMRSMIQYRYKVTAILFAMVCSALLAGDLAAQEARNKNFDLEYVRRQNGWLGSLNGSRLQYAPVNVSFAEGYFDKQGGDFKESWESPNSYLFGLKTESFRQFGKIGFYGKMQYEYFGGKDMSGSMLIQPGEYPYDLLEFTPGRKIRERYILSGGIGTELWGALSGGLMINYETDNYSKRVDLRHKNTRMDFEIMPGLSYTFEGITIGANFITGKKTETIEVETIGWNNNYDAFYNRGLWFGPYTHYEGSGLHFSETGLTGFPIINFTNGAALQFGLNNERGLSTFHEFAYRHIAGENGEKDYIWYFDKTNRFNYKGSATISGADITHLIRAEASYSDLKGYENIITREVISGVTQPVIYGHSLTLQQRKFSAALEYEMHWDTEAYNPLQSARLGVEYANRSLIGSLMYPYYYTQYVDTYRIYAGFDRNLYFDDSNILKLGATLGYYTGSGDKLTKGKTSAPAGLITGDYPHLKQDYMDYEWEYLTAGRVDFSLHARYTTLVGKGSIPLYFDLKYTRYNAVKEPEFLKSNNRNLFTIKVGCLF